MPTPLFRRNGLRYVLIFVYTKISHPLRRFSSFPKGHACCGYILVNADITPPLRYQPFGSPKPCFIFVRPGALGGRIFC